jgi:predicted amidohydrolase
MRLTLVQTSLIWENPTANRERLRHTLAPLAGATDLVVLPEMFTTGFSMNPAPWAESMNGPTLQWLHEQAEALNAAITGSFICVENGHFFNRLVWVQPDGTVQHYDKRHLFTLASEHQHYQAGATPLTVTWHDWRVRLNICYDLRFPVWSRNRLTDGTPDYDLLVYVANWPSRRAHHWRALLTARAVENQSYVAGVNVTGTDGNQLEYLGDTLAVDFGGQTLAHLAATEATVTVTLSLANLQDYRRQLPFLQDADDFKWPR